MDRLEEVRGVKKGAQIKALWQGKIASEVKDAFEDARARLEKEGEKSK